MYSTHLFTCWCEACYCMCSNLNSDLTTWKVPLRGPVQLFPVEKGFLLFFRSSALSLSNTWHNWYKTVTSFLFSGSRCVLSTPSVTSYFLLKTKEQRPGLDFSLPNVVLWILQGSLLYELVSAWRRIIYCQKFEMVGSRETERVLLVYLFATDQR